MVLNKKYLKIFDSCHKTELNGVPQKNSVTCNQNPLFLSTSKCWLKKEFLIGRETKNMVGKHANESLIIYVNAAGHVFHQRILSYLTFILSIYWTSCTRHQQRILIGKHKNRIAGPVVRRTTLTITVTSLMKVGKLKEKRGGQMINGTT